MADDSEVVEEVMEEMDDLKVDKETTSPKPRRRMPRRAMSSDQMAAPSRRRTPGRSRTGDASNPGGLAPLRRTATESGRVGRMQAEGGGEEGGEEDGTSPKPRRSPRRTKSSDGMAPRSLPSRSKSGTGPTRGTPKRTASGFGRTPRRTKSGDSQGFGLRKGRKKEKAGQTEDCRNIFGSDLVSTQKIIEDINELKELSQVIRLELEDFFMAERDDPDAIPLALKELLECDDRPWEAVQFLDDIMDASIYEEFRDRKKQFLRTMAGVCEARLIPVTYKAKITLSSGSLDMDEMVDMLFYLRSDKCVTELTLKSEQVDEGIIRALVELFKADKRKWKSVTLQLSGTGPGKPGSPEHNTWAKEMQAATEEMQKVCKERGIHLG